MTQIEPQAPKIAVEKRPNEKAVSLRSPGRQIWKRSVRNGAQSSQSSDTERTESEPHEIRSSRTLKGRPDMELPASLCSLRYLPFKFRRSISFLRLLAFFGVIAVQNPMGCRLFRLGSKIE